jgi:tRNA(adenine34) deaminase
LKRYGQVAAEPTKEQQEFFMREALKEARKALALGEIPVGAVIVRRGAIVSRAHNLRETKKNALFHAEVLAIEGACRTLGGWRLWDCDLYVTLEPCIMCAGAIVNARVRKVFWGANDPKAGAFGGKFHVNDLGLCHKPLEQSGLLCREASLLMQNFFQTLRNQK